MKTMLERLISILVVGAACIAIVASIFSDMGKAAGNHHKIVEIPTPRADVVCYALLNDRQRPTDLSCVAAGGHNAAADTWTPRAGGIQPGGTAHLQW